MNFLLTTMAASLICSSAWGWGFVKGEVKDPKLPKILLIGDSITAGYKWVVTRDLADKATVDAYCNPYNQACNAWHTELKEVLEKNGPYAVIHFNLGLHGWRKGDIPEGQFEPLTRKCVETIRKYAPDAKIIWASTTPVVTKTEPFALEPEINPIIVEHNAMAAKVMKECGIPINDLYAVMLPNLSMSNGDNVHWKDAKAGDLMGGAVAKAVIEQLEAASKKTTSTDSK